MIQLNELFCEIWSGLPDTQGTRPPFVEFSRESLPVPPESVVTGGLCVTKNTHFYNDFPVDRVSIEADKGTLGKLGLLILASLFHRDPPRVALVLTHPRSDIRRMFIGHDWGGELRYPGLHVAPVQFNYYPQRVSRHPWSGRDLDSVDLPVLSLTTQKMSVDSIKELSQRDVAVGFGTLEASCRFAELLLNASRPSNRELEFALECELGLRGVGPASAEIVIWLPGGLGNLDHDVLME